MKLSKIILSLINLIDDTAESYDDFLELSISITKAVNMAYKRKEINTNEFIMYDSLITNLLNRRLILFK